jgi:hypothetical protein
MEAGWPSMPPGEEMLYDLVFDPNETRNLVADPGHAEALGELRRRLEDWMRATRDPLLLDGDVPLPVTAKLNDRDGIQPQEGTLPEGRR